MSYFNKYTKLINEALLGVDNSIVDKATTVITNHIYLGDPVLVFGNGGSAAIAEHLTCDCMKGIYHDCTSLRPFISSLVSNHSLTTAIANDFGYDEVFSKQIEYCTSKHALVIGISSSGNSLNILKAFKVAKEKNYNSIAMVGFNGGKVLSENLANTIVHVNSENYGIVEDCHQIIMHTIAQTIRLEYSPYPTNLKL